MGKNQYLDKFVAQWSAMDKGENDTLLKEFNQLAPESKQWVIQEVSKGTTIAENIDSHLAGLQQIEGELDQMAVGLDKLKKEVILKVAKDLQPA